MKFRSHAKLNEGGYVAISDEEWFKFKALTERLDHHVFGNGKPPLEARVIASAHQDVMDLRTDMEKRHTENKTTFEKFVETFIKYCDKQEGVNRLVYIGMGIMIALEAVGLFKR